MTSTRLIAVLMLTILASAQSVSTDSPTFDVRYPKYSYSTRAASVKDIDFENMNLILFDEAGKPDFVPKLRRGRFEHHYPEGGMDEVELESVKYFGSPTVEGQRALVSVYWLSVGVSSSPSGLLQVFGIKDEHPFVFQQIEYNERGEGVGESFDPKSGTLNIKGVHGWEHCCPTTLDVGTFKWNGDRFQLIRAGSIPMPTTRR